MIIHLIMTVFDWLPVGILLALQYLFVTLVGVVFITLFKFNFRI